MYELIPIVVGASIGIASMRLGGWRAQALVVIPASVIVGIAAAILSGEIDKSWAFVLWDTAQALMAAVLANVLAARWLLRRARSDPGG